MYKLNLRQVSYALSEALDMVGIDDLYHGKRVAFMASVMCKALGYSQEKIDEMINIGMLHDCGVSNTDVHTHLVTELDWESSQNHCIQGAKLVKTVHFYENYTDVILYHHTHWSELIQLNISQKTMRDANIILLVDRVDALKAQSKSLNEIIEILQSKEDKMFSSSLVKTFVEISKPNSFWLYQENSNLEMFLQEWIAQDTEKQYEYKDIKQIAYMFANIVDSKSTFTGEHSLNVSKVALYLGKKFNLNDDKLEILELAALLHDLGKLRVSDSILEKQGPLNKDERYIMDRHGFDSAMILGKINGFKDIATLASLHHETLDGQGYPYQKKDKELNLEARILMLSDVFQALIQDRPYRKQLDSDSVLEILHSLKDEGKVDVSVLEVIEKNIDELYAIACSLHI